MSPSPKRPEMSLQQRKRVEHRGSTSRCRRWRLQLEPLESRRVLASLTVSVFVDYDASGLFDAGVDVPAAHRLVYVDLNRSGRYEEGEPIQPTNAEGWARFSDLDPGEYAVGLLLGETTQRQTTGSSPSQGTTLLTPASTTGLIGNANLEHPWRMDTSGRIQPLALDHAGDIEPPGRIRDAIALSDTTALLSVEPTSGYGSDLYRFDVDTETFSHLAVSWPNAKPITVDKLVRVDGQLFGIGQNGDDALLMELTVASETNEVDLVFAGPYRWLAPMGTNRVATVDQPPDGPTTLRLFHLADTTMEVGNWELPSQVTALEVAPDGRSIAVALEQGGIQVYQLDGTTLHLAAILGQATGPMAFAGDRLLSTTMGATRQVTVWEMQHWTILASVSLAAPHSRLTDILVSSDRRTALVAGDGGVERIELAQATALSAFLEDDESAATLEIGIQLIAENHPPEAPHRIERSVVEDGIDSGINLPVHDVDGDPWWAEVVWSPDHGQLSRDEEGGWVYRPAADYFGPDSALVRIYDSSSSRDVTLYWYVTPVDDPPIDLIVRTIPTAENASPGTIVGHASLVDVDGPGDYLITTLDPRFEIQAGQIIFAGGELDHESEPAIAIELVVQSPQGNGPWLRQIASLPIEDVRETPHDAELNPDAYEPTAPGSLVGSVQIIGGSVDSDSIIASLDDRFVVHQGELAVAGGIVLDADTEYVIPVLVRVHEEGEDYVELIETITVTVTDSNDPPEDIVLSKYQVPRHTAGAMVGVVSVVDPDGDDYYEITVLDDRFEIIDDVLKLRDGVSIDAPPDTEITLELVAQADYGDRISKPVALVVVAPRPQHQNPVHATDVNGDGFVTPLDALILINDLNRNPGGKLPDGAEGETPGIYPDVNGDGFLTPLDVLLIINELNRRTMSAGEGEPASDVAGTASEFFCPPTQFDAPGWWQHGDEDDELEQLIDHLARELE
ncbi:MAG: hypothetical protein KatS3mg111_0375 [Pirellulaceae bacterium]|nr:MAG: hypothetical protein KatS3mg111_0375 [Pirellulaceae bacterium]